MDTHTFLKNQAENKQKPGIKLIIIGIIIAVLGALVIPAILIFSRLASSTDEKQFTVPGNFSVDTMEPGQYFLWNHTSMVYKDVRLSFSQKDIPEELSIAVSDQDGRPLHFIKDKSYTVSINGNQKKSIGYVDIKAGNDKPSRLNVNVSGSEQKWYFSVSQFNFSRVLGFSIGIIGILLAIVGIGAVFIILGAKKLLFHAESKTAPTSTT